VSLVCATRRVEGIEAALVEGSEKEMAIWAKSAVFDIDVAREVE
jgi:hypothetical protein